jgi:hypothetical protein
MPPFFLLRIRGSSLLSVLLKFWPLADESLELNEPKVDEQDEVRLLLRRFPQHHSRLIRRRAEITKESIEK